MSVREIAIDALVPGGVRETDYRHRMVFDQTCSRCREPIPEDDVPLMCWTPGGEDLYCYCDACLSADVLTLAMLRAVGP